ncbi:MAG: T9SS type A sorting domain-containing protein [Bacteroidota bacterium]
MGIEHNNPYALDEWHYEKVVLRTAEKLLELNLQCDFSVIHTDAAAGNGDAYPYYVAPENIMPADTPTFSSVLNKVFEFYYDYYCNVSTSITNYPDHKNPIVIYPNPTNSNAVIELMGHIPATICIYNSLGALLQKTNIINEQKIEIQNLPGGLYFVQLQRDGQIVGSSKLIVTE